MLGVCKKLITYLPHLHTQLKLNLINYLQIHLLLVFTWTISQCCKRTQHKYFFIPTSFRVDSIHSRFWVTFICNANKNCEFWKVLSKTWNGLCNYLSSLNKIKFKFKFKLEHFWYISSYWSRSLPLFLTQCRST